MKSILKIIAWILVPYIMIVVDWRVLTRPWRIAAIAYTSMVLLSTCTSALSPLTDSNTTSESQPATENNQSTTATESTPPTATTIPPTATPEPPTNTPPPPTETPIPPTSTPAPDPIVITGSSDSIEDFENPFGAGLYFIEGNQCGRYFGVVSYDAMGNQVELLVNSTDPYKGVRPLDFEKKQSTRLEIKSQCAWSITIAPLTAIRVLDVPGQIEGTGDDVILLRGGTPDLAEITGNASGRYFGVYSYGMGSYDVMVNTTEPYTGKVQVNADSLIFEIKSVDDWNIAVTAR
jgi:hypothetical protein